MIFIKAADLESFFLSVFVQLAFQGYGTVCVSSDFNYGIIAVGEKQVKFDFGR